MTDGPLAGRYAPCDRRDAASGGRPPSPSPRPGAHVIAIGRTSGALEELDDEIRQAGSTATLVPLDLKDGDGIDRLGGALYGTSAGSTCSSAMPACSAR